MRRKYILRTHYSQDVSKEGKEITQKKKEKENI